MWAKYWKNTVNKAYTPNYTKIVSKRLNIDITSKKKLIIAWDLGKVSKLVWLLLKKSN